jgi:hypothetical protein
VHFDGTYISPDVTLEPNAGGGISK